VLEKYLQTEKKIFRACHGIVQTSKNSSDPLLIIRLNYKQLTHTHTHTTHTLHTHTTHTHVSKGARPSARCADTHYTHYTHYTHTTHTHTHTFQKAQDPPLDVLIRSLSCSSSRSNSSEL